MIPVLAPGTPTPRTDHGAGPDRGRRVLVIGDSMAAGAARLEGGALVERVGLSFPEVLMGRFPGWAFAVDAVPHRRTVDVAPALGSMLAAADPDIVVLTTGCNDTDLDWRRFVVSGGEIVRSRTPLVAFKEATRLIAAAIWAHGAVPVVGDVMTTSLAVRLAPLERAAGRDLAAMIKRGGGQARADQITGDYRRAVAEAAAEAGALVARYGEALSGHNPREVLCPDGTHVSAAGHGVIAAVLGPVLEAAAALVAGERARGAA